MPMARVFDDSQALVALVVGLLFPGDTKGVRAALVSWTRCTREY